MTQFKNKFDTHKEAFDENLEAIKILLDYAKTSYPDKWKSTEGCLGYSALILLCSHLNAFGNLFTGHKIGNRSIKGEKSTFQVLNSEYFKEQNLSTHILDEFYSCFRNKLTHNLALPKNFILKIKSDSGQWYELSNDNNGREIISTVYLVDLYELCVFASSKFQKDHKTTFQAAKNIANFIHKDLGENDTPQMPYASGNIS